MRVRVRERVRVRVRRLKGRMILRCSSKCGRPRLPTSQSYHPSEFETEWSITSLVPRHVG